MPSDRGKNLGARRLKLREARAASQRQAASEGDSRVESLSAVEQARMIDHVVEAAMGHMRHRERRSAARRQRAARRHSMFRMWAFRFFLVFLMFVWGLLLLSCFQFSKRGRRAGEMVGGGVAAGRRWIWGPSDWLVSASRKAFGVFCCCCCAFVLFCFD